MRDKIQKSEELVANSRLGTTMLAVIKLVNKNGSARYKDIQKLVFCYDDENKSAKLHHYIKLLSDKGIRINYITSNNKEKEVTIKNVISKVHGVYMYNKKNLLKLFLECLKFDSVDYTKKEYAAIFESEELQKFIFLFIDYYAKVLKVDELYSISNLMTNLEMLLVYKSCKNELKDCSSLKILADKIIDEIKYDNKNMKKE